MTDSSFYFKEKYRIPSARLKNWDYSSTGWYFVTICVKNREFCLGEIIDKKMYLSKFGKIVKNCWLDLPNHYLNIKLDEYKTMPNHTHGIVVIKSIYPDVETGFKPVSTKKYSLSEIIRGFKTFSAKKINHLRNTPNRPFWQSRFYDHIIRNEKSLQKIREYIRFNPLNWETDEENPKSIKF